MKTTTFLTLATLLLFTLGCEAPELDVPDSSSTTSAVAEATPDAEPEAPAEDEPVDMTGVENEPPPITSVPREFTAKDAKKGKKSRAAGGYLGTVAGAKFYAEYQMIINSYKHALNLYWGMEGEYPQTHEEFMEKIIKFNNLQLPELEAGVEYIYDPEDHLLKVYRPEG